MTNKQILRKVINKAAKNGYSSENELKLLFDVFGINYMFCNFGAKPFYYTIIFSHDFAKAIWGEKWVWYENFFNKCPPDEMRGMVDWQYHLQIMVLKKEPLRYIEKFLDLE